MRKMFISAMFILLTGLLAACSNVTTTPVPGSQTQEEMAAEQAVLNAIDEAFLMAEEEDSNDLSPSASLITQSVEPYIVIRRKDMKRSRELTDLVVDFDAEPKTAVVDVNLNVSGVAMLYEVYPDRSSSRSKVGEKAIDLTGSVSYTLEKAEGGRWQIVEVERQALSQGEYAAGISSFSISPDPLIAGSSLNSATVVLTELDTSDEFLLTARGGHLRPKGVLNDHGVAPDETSEDGTYSGYVEVRSRARIGKHIGFITALNYTKTTDLTMEEGEYMHPYTSTFLPVVVEIVEKSE